MKKIKQIITVVALAIFMLGSFSGMAQGGEDGCINLPPPLGDLIKYPISLKNLSSANKSNVSLKSNEITTYLVDFNNSLKSAKNINKSQKRKNANDYATILTNAEKDPKFQLVKPLINSASSIPQFLNSLNQIKPQILAMQGGADFYVKLSYSLQILNSGYTIYEAPQKGHPQLGKSGPNNSFELEGVVSDCWQSTITGVIAGAAVSGGNPIGGLIGGIIGGGVCAWLSR